MNNTVSKSNKRKRPSILLGIIIAIIIGTIVGGWFPDFAVRFNILGEVFLNSLMMIVVPIVMLSLIIGITHLGDIRNLGSIGGKTVVYYIVTTSIAVIIGIIIVNIIKPGEGVSPGETHSDYTYIIDNDKRTIHLENGKFDKNQYSGQYVLILMDQEVKGVIESFSENEVKVKFWENLKTEELYYITAENGTKLPFHRVDGQLISAEPQLKSKGIGVEISSFIKGDLNNKDVRNIGNTLNELLIGNKKTDKQGLIPSNIFSAMVHMDILPLIFFAILLGVALSLLGEKAVSTIQVLSTLNDAIMKIVHWIIIISPFGIFGLIAARIGLAGGFKGFIPELISLGKYSITVMIGLAIHGLIILPLILKIFGKTNPGKYAKGVATALLNAFSTASSTASLPLTLKGVVEENKVSDKTASFVLPLGATVNMDGTALYEAVAVIFIAQIYGIHLPPVSMGIIFLTATLAAIGAAGIPQAGLVTMVIVMKAVNLPLEGIGLILSIDWILDRFRTTVNVWGDSIGAAVIDKIESKKEVANIKS